MEVTSDSQWTEVLESSQVSESRRNITALSVELGLGQKTLDRVSIVCTELATNLIKHAGGGIMIAQGLSAADNVGIEIFAMDKGPGMERIDECLRDGYSTCGTHGTGLGAIKRLSDFVNISSSLALGTVVQTRIWQNKAAPLPALNYAGLSIPICSQTICGDKWCICDIDSGLYCILVDGLGHGYEACMAAKLAIKYFRGNLSLQPATMITELHQALKGTRGAVGAVAKIKFDRNVLEYAGLGNITGILVNDMQRKHLTSLNGTLGYEARRVSEFSFPWNSQSTLVMHSDGLSAKLSEAQTLLGPESESSALMAASLYLHYSQRTDDATVLVAKQTR